jgi:Rad3-related DNA helicase
MTAKTKTESFPKMANALRNLILSHPDERVLIHTVSYDLASFLTRELTARLGPSHRRLLTYRGAKERDVVIARYRDRDASVLIAPSLERGVDFKGDECRVVAVAKIPYPHLGDKQVSARMHSKGGQRWYATHTVRSLVQMTGRGMRSADDHCTTYILDTQFIDGIWKRSKSLLPEWWKAGLDMSARHVGEFSR